MFPNSLAKLKAMFWENRLLKLLTEYDLYEGTREWYEKTQ
ncbi:hypothetical protein PM8797T_22238 [Gimesia maris DSM 8797]|nr:hypothetical protein PM8797T_22238 [Gimesia maris DSM 8797]